MTMYKFTFTDQNHIVQERFYREQDSVEDCIGTAMCFQWPAHTYLMIEDENGLEHTYKRDRRKKTKPYTLVDSGYCEYCED